MKVKNIKSPVYEQIEPINELLGIKALIRIKCNMYPNTEILKEHGMHTDKENGKTGIFYINTCNGYTKFKNGKKIMSEENKYIEFNSKLPHTGASCTDKKPRVVINFNYI